MKLNRRELLERCAVFGAVTLASSVSLPLLAEAWDEAESKKTTPHSELGPFYKREAPHDTMLRKPGDAGMPMALAGVVYNTRGEVVPDSKIEIWHTDNAGFYDIDGYRFRTLLTPGPKGAYSIDSVVPGHYPSRVCQHVHYLVTAPGHKPLITQMYFATDPVFDGDPAKNYTRDPLCGSADLVRPVMIKNDGNLIVAAVTFDLVMEKA